MHLTINDILIIIAIIIHAIAGVIVFYYIIPLQEQQVGVKNGLIKLRKQMLQKGVLSLIVVVTSILILALRIDPYGWPPSSYITLLIFLHGIGIFAKTVIDYQIYHSQYSPESKDLHRRIDVIEKKDEEDLKEIKVKRDKKSLAN